MVGPFSAEDFALPRRGFFFSFFLLFFLAFVFDYLNVLTKVLLVLSR